MAKQQVTVPDIGGAEGAEVIELLVAVGDEVAVEQGLVVLESDKASMDIPSNLAGTVVEILVTVGDELAEGSAILVLEVAGEGQSVAAATDVEESPAEVVTEPVVSASEPEPAVKPATSGEKATVTVPDIGTDEAIELIEISVAVGDTVAEGDSLVVLESDKASMEVPAPYAGEVSEILVEEGLEIRQGDPLMVFITTPKAAETTEASAPAPAPIEKAVAPATVPSTETTLASSAASASKALNAGPAVRKLAREFGIDLTSVSGTGPRGRIVKEDLHAFSRKSQGKGSGAVTSGAGIPPIPEVDFSAFGEVETAPLSKIARLTAANMQRNWLNVPHVTQFDDADITELEDFRGSLKAEAERRGTRLTPMPFILKACAVALRDNPKFRSSLSVDGQSLVTKHYNHIGMAVDTPAGLMVPVIRDVDTKTVWELAEEVLLMAAKARDRKLMPVDMQGACFTISSLGNIGGTGFTPIVNAPEVGILGVSKAAIQPVWDGSEFQPRKMLPLSLSYDHRVVNGGDAGRFLTQLVIQLGDIRHLIL